MELSNSNFDSQQYVSHAGAKSANFERGHKKIESLQTLEDILRASGLVRASQGEIYDVINDQNLYCRSHSFSGIRDLFENRRDIVMKSFQGEPNMCRMSFGDGVRVAMEEGFPEDVKSGIKVIMAFDIGKENGFSLKTISRDSPLFKVKPKMANISVIGDGTIHTENVRMLFIRIHSSVLTEEEREEYFDEDDRGGKQFIILHYTKKTVH